ncbi:MAG: hypothetical protein GQ574_02065 [Crocinitomix sp.]|nr:hypothetical protein [Crocinitomix sp.]
MKKISPLLFLLILSISFGCQNEIQETDTELIEPDIEESILPIELSDTLIESIVPEHLDDVISDWKTTEMYIHFGASILDSVRIGPTRAIKNPFDYFSETRSNVLVLIDSGKYVNESALWIDGENVVIVGEDGVSILIDKLYDNVMWISGNNIVVDNLHMMHLMPGDSEGQNCSGRVVAFDNADNVTIVNCDLNGCGLAGLHDNSGNGTIYVEHNYIHNNSLGAYTNIAGDVWQEEISDHETFVFKNNRMENNGFDRIFEGGDEYYEEDFHGEH